MTATVIERRLSRPSEETRAAGMKKRWSPTAVGDHRFFMPA
ncbi:hypothetical protein [Streptomyces canus]|nr:hypothetical protein [Streptomyces canus]